MYNNFSNIVKGVKGGISENCLKASNIPFLHFHEYLYLLPLIYQLVTVYLGRWYQFTSVTAVSGKSGKIRSGKCTGNIEKSVEICKKLDSEFNVAL